LDGEPCQTVSEDFSTRHNDKAQLKWARKGRPESDTISQPRLAKFPLPGVVTSDPRSRTRLAYLA
jgi:hypothetical protein